MSRLAEILADLNAEGDRLRAAVTGLDDGAEGGWRTPTPAAGWDVATQVAHLAWTDEMAALAAASVTEEAAKARWDAAVVAALQDPDGFVDAGAFEVAQALPEDLLARWDQARRSLAAALESVPEGSKMPWFGPPMAPASMATARFMETWAHGLDVYQALGIEVVASDRIRHVCHLGARTRDFAYLTRGLTPPAEQFRIELTGPGGEVWTWGPEDAPQRVAGSAWDFARLVTQRAHHADTDLTGTGDAGDEQSAAYWLTIAQAFAGPPGAGRTQG